MLLSSFTFSRTDAFVTLSLGFSVILQIHISKASTCVYTTQSNAVHDDVQASSEVKSLLYSYTQGPAGDRSKVN